MWFKVVFIVACSQICFSLDEFQTRKLVPDHRIVGGEDVDISTCGWQISLQRSGRHFCGGSIISNNWILTASHCVENIPKPVQGITIRVGSSLHNSGGRVHRVADYHMHPLYSNRTGYDFDIALLELETPVSYSVCSPLAVDLAESGSEVQPGAMLSVTGWGATMMGGPSSVKLQGVKVPAITQEECSTAYRGRISDSMICAAYPEGGKDSCQGDSGGPLVDENRVQVGVVSWGEGCALPGKPGVYAKVSHPEVTSFLRQYVDI